MDKEGIEMPLSSEYYERILDAVESSESAFDNGDMEEAATYMEEVRAIAAEDLEEMEETEDYQENGEQG
jgi:hypothetical protein